MTLKRVIINYWSKIKKLPRKYTVPSAVFLGIIFAYVIIFLIHKPVAFSYAGETCARQLTLFPSLHKLAGKDKDFSVNFKKSFKVGSFTILSLSTCFTATDPPTEGTQTVATALFGGWFMQKHFSVKVEAPPVADVGILNKPVPTLKPLKVPLSDTDKVFTYTLRANERKEGCESQEKVLLCDIKQLNLTQGASYAVELTREFKNKQIGTVAKRQITTLPATSIIDSSIKQGETVFSKPRTIEITFDKKIAKANPTLYKIEGNKRIKQSTKTSIQDKKLQISMNELPRLSDYVLEADNFEAIDGSGLAEPLNLSFKMSGSPKVTAINIGTTHVPLGSTAVITFDQALSEKQDTTSIITASGGAAISAKKGNQVFVNLAGVPKCGNFSIKITNDLQSAYDIGGNSAWTFNGRMICYTVSTIGYSLRGRPINAYYFGSGGSTVLYTGAIHGNEYSSSYILKDWIGELDANAANIPTGRQIVVVPTLNPDGFAAGTRNNAANVNLNRNFDVSDWKADINDTNGTVKGGGGPAPMSEPETRAIANLSRQLHPRLVLSYHAVGSVAIGNQAGDSAQLAAQYASMVDYRNGTGSSSEVFDYEITGTYDDWLAEKMGIPSMVIELGSNTFRDFSHHRAAFWAMAKS
jgi:predicted deacylase